MTAIQKFEYGDRREIREWQLKNMLATEWLDRQSRAIVEENANNQTIVGEKARDNGYSEEKVINEGQQRKSNCEYYSEGLILGIKNVVANIVFFFFF